MRIFLLFMTVCLNASALWAQESDAGPLKLSLENSESFSMHKENSPPSQTAGLTMKSILPLQTDWSMRDFSSANSPQLPIRFQAFATPSPSMPPQSATYNKGYVTRRKIHKYASIATLPLFAAEAVVGQKLFNRTGDESDSLRSAHTALSAGIGVLFGVNTVTGVWDMWETRKMSHGRGKRLFHGITMLAADAGFLATAALAPDRDDDGFEGGGGASAHRAVAFAALGVATVSYVYMLIAK